nr:ubiquinol-cytochrome C chaperone family protein [Alcaligenes faecalis]
MAEEVQRFGANGFVTNIFRGGKGVLYKEVLGDVCEKMKVNFNKDASVHLIEENLLMKILADTLEKMSTQDINELAQNLGLKNREVISAEMLLASFQTIFVAGGFKSYQLTLIIVNAISKALFGRGLALAGNAMLARTASILTGPIGWTITGIWTAIDLAGPAYRITIPAAIHIAVLRKKHALTLDDLTKDLGQALG